MSVLKPRNRLVYFRVSEDEFQQFNQMCESVGARSISDLARSAIQRMIQQDGNHQPQIADPVAAKLTILETIVCDLDRKVQQLTALIGWTDPVETRLERLPDRIDSINRKA
jgi:hypothetical protein